MTIASTGTLGIEISGAANSSQYDHVTILGQLLLGGTLNVVLAGGFAPSAGNSFDILDWGSITGTFSSIELPTLSGGLQWNTSQLYTTGTLSVTASLPGDYNQNGVVDAADYTLWRNHLGQNFTLLNENPAAATPGVVDAEDYAFWKSHYGESADSGSGGNATATVPEPMTLLLLIFAAMGPCLRRCRAPK